METVDVIVATYGNPEIWNLLAQRAIASVENQSLRPGAIHRLHDTMGSDLSSARNAAASWSNADWLIFLDADDELHVDYCFHMLKGEGDLRWPSTLGVVDGREDDYPVLIQPKASILIGNHMVIGTMVRRELFMDVGGFRLDLPVLEDWDLWIRCLAAGARARPCPEAIYRVHVSNDSRNQNTALHSHYYREIQQRYSGTIFRG